MSDLTKDLAVVVNGNIFDHYFAPINCVKFLRLHHATIQQNAEDAAKYRNDGSTHAEGCYAWGPKHYECALRKLREGAEDAKRLRALERAMVNFMPPLKRQAVWARADEILREGEPHDQD